MWREPWDVGGGLTLFPFNRKQVRNSAIGYTAVSVPGRRQRLRFSRSTLGVGFKPGAQHGQRDRVHRRTQTGGFLRNFDAVRASFGKALTIASVPVQDFSR
jgi:hypothetical protein